MREQHLKNMFTSNGLKGMSKVSSLEETEE